MTSGRLSWSGLGDWMAGQGVRIAFHHHMGTVIETAAEIDRLMEGTPDNVGLLFDTGYLTFAGEDFAAVSRRWANRINHVYAKDVRPDVLARAWGGRLSFLISVVAGVFTVPSDGSANFVPALRPMAEAGDAGWLIVEADQNPAQAHPPTYACRDRAALHAAEAADFHVI